MFLTAPLLALALLAGCAQPQSPADAPTARDAAPAPSAPVASNERGLTPVAAAPEASKPATPVPATGIAGRTRPAPPMSAPLPPERVDAAPRAPAVVTSCRTRADCAVKNVGSCCGAMPACVNVNAPTDPAAVQAACAKSGMSSTCGFREIQSCSCVAGTCQDAGGSAPVADR